MIRLKRKLVLASLLAILPFSGLKAMSLDEAVTEKDAVEAIEETITVNVTAVDEQGNPFPFSNDMTNTDEFIHNTLVVQGDPVDSNARHTDRNSRLSTTLRGVIRDRSWVNTHFELVSHNGREAIIYSGDVQTYVTAGMGSINVRLVIRRRIESIAPAPLEIDGY